MKIQAFLCVLIRASIKCADISHVQILNYPISVIPPAWNSTAFLFFKSEYQYTVYFRRGVDNTPTEFGAKAVIDTSLCRLDIPLDLDIISSLREKLF